MMNRTFRYRWLSMGLLLSGVAVSGCDSSPASRPPTASVGTAATRPAAEKNSPDEKTVAATTGTTVAADSAAKPKFDPILENGKFFEGWPKPKLALVISGRQDGYLEPCGCAGLENQKGGFNRRHALFKQLQEQGWPLAAVDVGGLVRRFGKQAEVQFGISAEALKQMGYNAVAFGAADLRLSAGEIVAAVAGAQPEDSIFLSANVNLFGLTPKVRIIEAGGMKLGITAVLGKEFQQKVNNAEIEIQPAAEALKAVVGELKNCDVRILLAHATADECAELAKQFPEFELVVSGDDIDVPRAQPEIIPGTKSRLVEVGHKGMYVVVVGFYDDPKQPVRYQRVALDSRYPDTAEMKALMATYQDQLQQLGWNGLGLKQVPHPRAQRGDKTAGQFLGAESCKECHPTAWGIWSKTKHAHATESLTKAVPPRQYDPECVSCHATGWNPQEFFPFVGGFDSLEKTPHLAGNSCENCHGPGGAHVAAENGRNLAKRDAEREALKLSVATAKENVCTKCHDIDNSPNFIKDLKAFDAFYWPKVEHKGKR